MELWIIFVSVVLDDVGNFLCLLESHSPLESAGAWQLHLRALLKAIPIFTGGGLIHGGLRPDPVGFRFLRLLGLLDLVVALSALVRCSSLARLLGGTFVGGHLVSIARIILLIAHQ